MTVVEAYNNYSKSLVSPRLATILTERKGETPEDSADSIKVQELNVDSIFSNLKIGIDITSAVKLSTNKNIFGKGMELRSNEFILSKEQAISFGYDELDLEKCPVIHRFLGGRDITDKSRILYAIDLFCLL